MKKLLFLTIIALLSFVLLSCNDKVEEPSDATVAPESDFEYEENADGGITITKYKGNDENVVVPETLGGLPVTEIGQEAFGVKSTITKIVISKGVKTIGPRAFHHSHKLVSVVLPEGLEKIGHAAFWNCPLLSDISLPSSLKTLEDLAFESCDSLKKIVLPSGLDYLGGGAFMNSGLEIIDIQSNLSSIRYQCFSGTRLTEISIPNSVVTIESFTFAFCHQLKTVSFGNNLEELGKTVFLNDESLTEIVLPESLKKIYETEFENCDNLTSVKFEGQAPAINPEPEGAYSIEDGQPIKKNKSEKITVYYHEGAEGFGGTWNGYKTQVW